MFRRDLPAAERHSGGVYIRLDSRGRIAPGRDGGFLESVATWPDGVQPLGFWHDQPVAVLVEAAEHDWPSARQWLGELGESHFMLLSTALQVVTWQRDHRFCGRCASQTRRIAGEFAMHCDSCGQRNYPRISPCIITLVTHGEDLLLARSPRFPAGRYSTLAGFIEPGEAAEDAVRREVYEEVGLSVGRVTYFRSQPWPFPHSLMLGFFAEAASRRIRIDGVEIADAAWFTPRRLPQLPPAYSISRALIEAHLQGVRAR
ncbi:NAD(+) diphosphatase [Halomonas sp. HP20-15]|uniref:NAD(+) diphosphatase n=1 Tax=Halomonas sp. HP20-15 TaxID=3085901 RepID=UPI002980CA0B|nr:NAD(+) diphosphatase [Halomonas sp. HP20-15]MDW5375474.1 NAD(+) diphosphatase [Halomonas sp. HP20-15]